MADESELNYGARLVELGNCYIDHIDRRLDALQISADASQCLAARLDDDAASLRELAARLSIRINRLNSPLLRLPRDVLCLILSDLAAMDDEDRTWFRAGHICSFLRSTLLDMAALWAENICMLEDEDALEEFLRRSKDLPIRLKAPGDSRLMLEFALQHLDRAYRFETNHPSVAQILRRKSLPLPVLADLELQVEPDEVAIWKYHQNFLPLAAIDEESSYIISPKSYDKRPRALPNLRRLSMTGINVSLCSDALTELRLVRTFMPMSSTLPSLKQLLAYFRCCPNLEHIQLCGWLPVPPVPVSADGDNEEDEDTFEVEEHTASDSAVQEEAQPLDVPVPFRRLRLLELWGDRHRIAALWPYLEIPYTAEVSVRMGYTYDGTKEICDYLLNPSESSVLETIPVLCSHIAAQPAERTIVALCVRADLNRNNRLCFTLYAQKEDHTNISPHLVDVPRLAYDSSDWPGYIAQAWAPVLRLDICSHRWRRNDCILAIVRSLCEIFRLRDIQVLGLQLEPEMVKEPATCGEILDHFPAVHTLEILNPFEGILESLSLPADASPAQPSAPRHLPVLRELVLGVNPDNKSNKWDHPNALTIGECDDHFHKTLLSVATSRTADCCSSPLERIVLRQSNGSEEGIDPAIVEELRQHILVENDLD